MKNKILITIIIFKTIGCFAQSKKITSLHELKIDNCVSYQLVKKEIQKKKASLKISDNSLSSVFKAALVYKIIPFWEKTKWTFSGHTSVPKKGTIACGYFVSTTLKHIGLNINRYKLAQQSPINEAKSLAGNSEVKVISNNTVLENIVKIANYTKEGIYFIGFDQSHVGFLLKEKGNIYLIHSNYINAQGVVIEPIETSEAFASYTTFYIAALSTNTSLLKSWVNNTPIKIILK